MKTVGASHTKSLFSPPCFLGGAMGSDERLGPNSLLIKGPGSRLMGGSDLSRMPRLVVFMFAKTRCLAGTS